MSSLFDPTTPSKLDEQQARAVDLAAALDGAEGWTRIDGATFVAAGRTSDGATVVGNSGGWWTIRHRPDGGPSVTSEQQLTAQAAVKLADEPLADAAPAEAAT